MTAETVPPRVVLDTNVCLDLFLFGDPRVAVLDAALRAGAVVAVTDIACRGEWRRVLAYPQLGLDEAAQAAAQTRFDALVTASWPHEGAREPTTRLPRCVDPDDQKFLELALRSGARWLLSRDEHLLALGRRTAREGWFEIHTPQDWARHCPLPAAVPQSPKR